ncbi:hypothetical protein PR003_g24675, partial [Phytophthora rubi]
NSNTGKTYADYAEFCKAGGVEFSVAVSGSQVKWIEGLKFWANPGDSNANAMRAENVVTTYSNLVKSNPTTTDGGVMKPLPTVESLTANNPPCYKNSKICAKAKFGCKRSYCSQICEVCTSATMGCVKAIFY